MALTKLPKNAIGTGAVDASKIEDGTIQNAELAGSLTGTQLASTLDLSSKTITLPNTSVTSNQLVNSTIANNKLSNSTITVRGTSRALGDSFSIGVDVDWQSVITADGSTGTTGSAGRGYFIDTTSAAHTFTLPASATRGDTIGILDYAGTFATNKLTIARNGHNIQGVANNSLIGTNRASLILVYADVTKGWLFAEENNVADLQEALFITATGGTVTTSGDFKIHSFTGDGCFVVSTLGNPAGGGSAVDYLVVAGGGGGGSDNYPDTRSAGGGGAGGFRMSNVLGLPAPTTSPLSNPTGVTVTTTTYPITVGGGGAGGIGGGSVCTAPGSRGSNSVFSTITSTGGGAGVGHDNASGGSDTNIPGGSGGGNQGPGGLGNTPPVSPPQGNNGGAGAPNSPPNIVRYRGGGGGGAGATGANGLCSGNGGVGSFVSPSFAVACAGTPGPAPGVRYFSGGGGAKPSGTGGSGGGGNASTAPHNTPGPATTGTANTGGGGGSSFGSGAAAGGKGIVIIRYKFQ